MGTDIHSVLEVKSNGKWLGVGHDLTTKLEERGSSFLLVIENLSCLCLAF